MIGTKTGHKIGKNKDGDRDVILLQVEISDEEDVQTVQLFNAPGEDSVPVNGSDIVIIAIEESWKIGIAVDQLVAPDGVAGQKKSYSVDSGGNVAASLTHKTDGKNSFNDGTIKAARENDSIASNPTDDAVFWGWVTTISAAVNALSSGSVPIVPDSLTGKITNGTDKVLLPS